MDMDEIPEQVLRESLPYCAGIWALSDGKPEDLGASETNAMLATFVNGILENIAYDPDTGIEPTEEELKAAAKAVWPTYWKARQEDGEPHKTWETKLKDKYDETALNSLLETPDFFVDAFTSATGDGLEELMKKTIEELEKETEPEKAEPEKAEPEKAEPEKAEPEKAEPEKETEPEKAEPEKAEPEKAEPKAEPEKAEPKAEPEDNDPQGGDKLFAELLAAVEEPRPEAEKPVEPKLCSIEELEKIAEAIQEETPPLAARRNREGQLMNWTFYAKFMILAGTDIPLSQIILTLRNEGYIQNAADVIDLQLCWAMHLGTPISEIYGFSLVVDDILAD